MSTGLGGFKEIPLKSIPSELRPNSDGLLLCGPRWRVCRKLVMVVAKQFVGVNSKIQRYGLPLRCSGTGKGREAIRCDTHQCQQFADKTESAKSSLVMSGNIQFGHNQRSNALTSALRPIKAVRT